MKSIGKVSVIIAIYNVEKFLKQSIESVINQTYEDLEIILVDDGSKDSSGKICDDYAKKDKRIKVIHKQNGGASSARNAGIDIATGKYMCFIDSDDFIEKNACEILIKTIERVDTDYVMANYIYTNQNGEKWNKPMFDVDEDFEVSIKDYDKSFFVMNSVVCNKLYKSKFIKENNLRFKEGVVAEDAIFSTYCYTHTEKGYFIKDVVYNYRQNEENASVSTSGSKEFFRKSNEAYKIIFKNFEETDNINFYRLFCARIMPYFICKIIDSNELKSDEDIEDVLNMFKWYFKQKETYKVIIINEMLNEIIDNINNNNIKLALTKIKEVKSYRKGLTGIEKEKMIAVSNETYQKMKS